MKKIFILASVLFIISCGGSDSNSSQNWDIDTSNMNPNENVGDWAIIHELSDPDRLNPIKMISFICNKSLIFKKL